MRQIASLTLAVVALLATVSAPAAATIVQTSEQPGLIGPGDAPTGPDGLGELLAEHDCRPVGNGSYNHYQCTVDGIDVVVDVDSFRTGDGFDTDNPFLAAYRNGQLPSGDDLSVEGVETERVHPGPAHLETLDANDDSWIYRHVGDDGGTVWTDNIGDNALERDFNASEGRETGTPTPTPVPDGTDTGGQDQHDGTDTGTANTDDDANEETPNDDENTQEVCENCGSDKGNNISYSVSNSNGTESESSDTEKSVPDNGENAEEVCENCGSEDGPNISYSISNSNGTESDATDESVPNADEDAEEVCENCGSEDGPNISFSVSDGGDAGDEHPVCGWCNNPHVPDIPHNGTASGDDASVTSEDDHDTTGDDAGSDGGSTDASDGEKSVPEDRDAEEVCENCGSDEGNNISYSVADVPSDGVSALEDLLPADLLSGVFGLK